MSLSDHGKVSPDFAEYSLKRLGRTDLGSTDVSDFNYPLSPWLSLTHTHALSFVRRTFSSITMMTLISTLRPRHSRRSPHTPKSDPRSPIQTIPRCLPTLSASGLSVSLGLSSFLVPTSSFSSETLPSSSTRCVPRVFSLVFVFAESHSLPTQKGRPPTGHFPSL